MGNIGNDQMSGILTMVLAIMISILFILVVIFVWLKIKERKKASPKEAKEMISEKKGNEQDISVKTFSKKSIYKFMDFDTIEDNMIIQKKSVLSKYIMVIECQGINYDLMSGIEKAGVEQGFLQFLNTLRYPIQIYIQTRTVNLTNSIETYNHKVKDISMRLNQLQMHYNDRANSDDATQKELDNIRFEIIKMKNLYEYGVDVVKNTERMSLNKNVLNQKYYIIISYYPEDIGENFDKSEVRNIAFSELYTKAQTIISSISSCGVKGKVMTSNELVELLYSAYNRDESETYTLEKALKARYDEMYVTAEDVLDRKMRAINEEIETKANEEANNAIFEVVNEREKEREVKEQEARMEDLINQMAQEIIEENKGILGTELASEAKDKVKKKRGRPKKVEVETNDS